MFQVYLTYDRALARPNTFFYIPELETIRCRIRVAGAKEVSPVDVHLRFRNGKAPGLVHVHQIDGSRFVTELAQLHDDLPRIELVLVEVPVPIANALRAL
jgi:hypothetical protein